MKKYTSTVNNKKNNNLASRKIDYLTKTDFHIFNSIIDGIYFGSEDSYVFDYKKPSQLGYEKGLNNIFSKMTSNEKNEFRLVLKLLNNRCFCLFVVGIFKPITKMSSKEVNKVFEKFANSSIKLLRKVSMQFTALSAWSIGRHYDNYQSPILNHSDYQKQNVVPKPIKELTLLKPKENDVLETDVIVIGSGAGGGVAAAVLSKSGYDVIMIEKGSYKERNSLSYNEGTAMHNLYERAGLLLSDKQAVAILAGSCLGGGTTINWTTSFITPQLIREEWDRIAGFDTVFTSKAFTDSSKAIEKRININNTSNKVPLKDKFIREGLEKIGCNVHLCPRNVKGCDGDDCGFCGLGCKKGAKQSTLETWIRDLAKNNGKIIANSYVKNILIKHNKAVGINAVYQNKPYKIMAKTIVVSAGSLHTPAILQRSGVSLPACGKNLRLHPVIAVAAKFAEKVNSWHGSMQGIYCDDYLYRDDNNHGYIIETCSGQPGLVFGANGFVPSREKMSFIEQYDYTTSGIAIISDQGVGGRVFAKKDGSIRYSYQLDSKDMANLHHSIQKLCLAFEAGGSEKIMFAYNPSVTWIRSSKQPIEDFIQHILKLSFRSYSGLLFSAHQMGTARMGRNPKTSVCNEDGQVHGIENLYIMDASTFPRCSGVNPMVSIQTIAHMNATKLARNLQTFTHQFKYSLKKKLGSVKPKPFLN